MLNQLIFLALTKMVNLTGSGVRFSVWDPCLGRFQGKPTGKRSLRKRKNTCSNLAASWLGLFTPLQPIGCQAVLYLWFRVSPRNPGRRGICSSSRSGVPRSWGRDLNQTSELLRCYCWNQTRKISFPLNLQVLSMTPVQLHFTGKTVRVKKYGAYQPTRSGTQRRGACASGATF